MNDKNYDLVVIGGGPGGYTAAIRAAQLGLQTALVEREHLGGICSNWGCIPTKALLRSAEVLDQAHNLAEFGVALKGEVAPDLNAMVSRSRAVAARMNGGVASLLRKNKVDIIWGEAKLLDKGGIEVSEPAAAAHESPGKPPKRVLKPGSYSAKHIIIATGARPRHLPGLEPDGKHIWSYYEALVPDAKPAKLIVVGSGAIGMEFASFYRSLGSKVTLIEAQDRLMPLEDEEVSAFVARSFAKRGVEVIAGAKVDAVETTAKGVSARISGADGNSEKRAANKLIAATGVVANIEGLGLEALGVATGDGVIEIDPFGRTNVEGVYAVGDVAGGPMLAHKAEHEAMVCVEAIAGEAPHPLRKERVPGCTYCHPQVASIGLTEAEAHATGREIKIGRFPFLANGKAIALGDDEGMAKTIFDAGTGELLGAHLVGPEVTELIHGFATAMELEGTEAELIDTVFAHPTLSEVVKESVMHAFGRSINI